ncbi:MAG: dTMP kinase [Patescibacteria group bacterium UBA2103]
MKRGKLIVLDGGDGSGKATQTKLLLARLKKEKVKVRTLDFPQYEENVLGNLIGACIRGEHGDFLSLDPHIASVLYVADRFESKTKIENWLKKGYTVVLDRYVSANQIHQGGKIQDKKKLKEFLTWLDTLEHKVFKIPRPDQIIYLDMPVDVAQKLLLGAKDTKTYLKGKKDTTEEDLTYQENSKKNALQIVKKLNAWHKVPCAKRGEPRSREDIHEDVWAAVAEVLKKKA